MGRSLVSVIAAGQPIYCDRDVQFRMLCDIHKAFEHVFIFCTRGPLHWRFLLAIQIRWKFRLVVIQLLAIRSQQVFAHATTAQLSWHVQKFVTITLLESGERKTRCPSNLNCNRKASVKGALSSRLHVDFLWQLSSNVCLFCVQGHFPSAPWITMGESMREADWLVDVPRDTIQWILTFVHGLRDRARGNWKSHRPPHTCRSVKKWTMTCVVYVCNVMGDIHLW